MCNVFIMTSLYYGIVCC